jgi:hypothetical protein
MRGGSARPGTKAQGMLGCGFVVFVAGVQVGFHNPAVLGSVFALVAAVLRGIFGPTPLPTSAAAPKNPAAGSAPAENESDQHRRNPCLLLQRALHQNSP